MTNEMRARMNAYRKWVQKQDAEYAGSIPCPCKPTDEIEREKHDDNAA